MSDSRKSAASVENTDTFIIAAPATMAMIQQSAEYKSIETVEDAVAIIRDAIATGTLLYGSGKKVTSFPGYWGLRFLATQEKSDKAPRPYTNASNTLLVRAAAAKVFKGSPKPASNGDTTVRTKTAAPPECVMIPWQGSALATYEVATTYINEYADNLAAYAVAQKKNLAEKVLDKLSDTQKADLLAMLLAMAK